MKKILIASTLKEHLEAEKAIFKRTKYKVYTAASGEEVLQIHREKRADLIIADLKMNGMNGDDVCAHIRKKMDKGFKDVHMILVCDNNKADIEKCTKSRANLYVTKPFKNGELLKEVRQLLDLQPRSSDRLHLKIKIVGSYSYDTFFCHAHNLSTSGLLIESDRVLHKGKSISFLLCLPELPGQVTAREVAVNGEIVRVDMKPNNCYEYGVRFGHLTGSAKTTLDHYFSQIATSPA